MPKLESYSPTPAARAGRIVMTIVPFFMAVICVFLSFVPVGRIFGSSVTPAFAFMAIYYWGVVRPEMFPSVAVFAVGLILDLLSGGPIGLWAFVYVVTYAVVISQRFMLVNAPFSAFWMGFVAASAFASVLAWMAASLFYGTFVAAGPIIWHMTVTVIVFPLFAFIFGRVQSRVLNVG
ncbi:MAG: rod shape-determining protein MreD [Rhizobiales bacterium]|nr:rod shape-determining protein MreD [Hyphomicrobiales bacterium]